MLMMIMTSEIDGNGHQLFFDLLSCTGGGGTKSKVKLSLCLTKHPIIKTYWGVEV
jgi:hypothetical protein